MMLRKPTLVYSVFVNMSLNVEREYLVEFKQ
jgi:hypothetical protein